MTGNARGVVYGVLVIVVLAILLPIGMLLWRFREGETPAAGGSFGWQFFRRDKDDWGPKNDAQP